MNCNGLLTQRVSLDEAMKCNGLLSQELLDKAMNLNELDSAR